jgi:pimeloyl-ACP methyl ester carboxylesterase
MKTRNKSVVVRLAKISLLIIVCAISIILAGWALMPSRIRPAAEVKQEFSQEHSYFYTWRGKEIHYTDEGEGIPVLMIHGLGGSLRNFQKLTGVMPHGYRILRVDLPGFGMSDFPYANTQDTVDYIATYRAFISEFLDYTHVDSVYVIGNSLGGWMSWDLATIHPEKVKKLVLISSAGYDMEAVAKNAAAIFEYDMVHAALKKGVPEFITDNAIKRSHYNTALITGEGKKAMNAFFNREGNIEHMFKLIASKQYADTARIKMVQAPTLIIWGKQDGIIPVAHAEKFHRDIPGSEVVIIDSCGHVAQNEKTEQVLSSVLRFFNNGSTTLVAQ